MLTALLLASLPVSSTVSTEVHAALDAQHTRVRLVSDDAPLPSFDSMTGDQLQREYNRLDAERPGLVMPVLLIAAGAAVAYLGTQLFSLFDDGTAVWLAVLGGSYVVGLVLVIVGIVVLINHMRARVAIDNQLDEIKRRLESPTPPGQPVYPGQPGYPGAPPDNNVPPPPPPPPPAAQNLGINAVRTVALLEF